jgi:hypothetical protein
MITSRVGYAKLLLVLNALALLDAGSCGGGRNEGRVDVRTEEG